MSSILQEKERGLLRFNRKRWENDAIQENKVP